MALIEWHNLIETTYNETMISPSPPNNPPPVLELEEQYVIPLYMICGLSLIFLGWSVVKRHKKANLSLILRLQKDIDLFIDICTTVLIYGTMLISKLYCYRYYSDANYIVDTKVTNLYAKLDDENILEVFATITNVCYLIGSYIFAIIIWFFPGKVVVPHTIVTGVLFVSVASTSWAHHASGSLIGSWGHQVDRAAMFVYQSWSAIFAITGFLITILNKYAQLQKIVLIISFLTGCVVMFAMFTHQQRYASEDILFKSGFVMYAFMTVSIFIRYMQINNGSFRKVATNVVGTLLCLLDPLLTFGLGLLYNLNAESYQSSVKRQAPNRYSSMIDLLYNVNLNHQYDILHGLWHFLVAHALIKSSYYINSTYFSFGKSLQLTRLRIVTFITRLSIVLTLFLLSFNKYTLRHWLNIIGIIGGVGFSTHVCILALYVMEF